MATYTINLVNESSSRGNFYLFQKNPSLPDSGNYSLAWIVKSAAPRSRVPVSWDQDYYFFWAESGVLKPGVIFNAGEALKADIFDNNEVTLTKQDDNYKFIDQKRMHLPGTLKVTADSKTAVNEASIGIGMSGAAAFAIQAQPDKAFMFVPMPEYWISFGDFQPGEVLDIENMTRAVQIVFPHEVFSMNATLNADNTWTITEGDHK